MTVVQTIELTGPTTPLYGSIVIMGLILFGVTTFLMVDWFGQKRAKKKGEKVGITVLTDFELRPIEQQDINYEDAVSMFQASSRSMISKNNFTNLDIANSHRGSSLGHYIDPMDAKKTSGLLSPSSREELNRKNRESILEALR